MNECKSNSVIATYSEIDPFTVDGEAWNVRLSDGSILTPTWNSRGAAVAGAITEMRRMGIHVLSRDCWCNPTIESPAQP